MCEIDLQADSSTRDLCSKQQQHNSICNIKLFKSKGEVSQSDMTVLLDQWIV
jgi:hypothetical protein